MLQSTTRPVTRSKSSRQTGAATKGVMNSVAGFKPCTNRESWKPAFDTDPTPSTTTQTSRRKRRRNSGDSLVSTSNKTQERTIIKKPKSLDNPPAKEDISVPSDFIPSVELEDISKEVEARLKLREETRRKKRERQRKRKRESIESSSLESRTKKAKNS